ncbi:hypothetical protein [Microbacterium resistens]|uniref:hypothetical protein n=1 Tax=Microbacterium resistens TaxID=156977 RepID=UPI000835E36B|nr:hypothetical protein [Microbacterium resistens]
MALIDDLLTRDIPMYPFSWGSYAEADYGDRERPKNIKSVGELISTQTYPESKVHMTYAWITEQEDPIQWSSEHVHDYDEILMWKGNDPENPHELGAEIYIEIEGERRSFTKSGSIYIPAGVRHCPLGFIRVDRPFLWHALSLAPNYHATRTDA